MPVGGWNGCGHTSPERVTGATKDIGAPLLTSALSIWHIEIPRRMTEYKDCGDGFLRIHLVEDGMDAGTHPLNEGNNKDGPIVCYFKRQYRPPLRVTLIVL